MYEKVISDKNIEEAFKRIKRNNGSYGIDKMQISEINSKWIDIKERLIYCLKNDLYSPNLIRRCYIPKKGSNKMRPLGIPTVIDRIVQQSLLQVLSPIYENYYFSKYSFGYREGKSCNKCVTQLLEYFNSGYIHVLSLDLENYFGTINHERLILKLQEKVTDERIISLINKFLKAKILDSHNKIIDNVCGTPQGGNLSPLLANLYLHSTDKILEQISECKFVRYCDDIIIVTKDIKVAKQLMKQIEFIFNNEQITLNKHKSHITSIEETKYLGFKFDYDKKSGKYIALIDDDNLNALYAKLFKYLNRSFYYSNGKENTIIKINELYLGFINYYKSTYNICQLTIKLDKIINTSLKLNSLKNYKNSKTKFHKLKEIGLCKEYIDIIMKSSRKEYWKLCEYYINKSNIYNLTEIKFLKSGNMHLVKHLKDTP